MRWKAISISPVRLFHILFNLVVIYCKRSECSLETGTWMGYATEGFSLQNRSQIICPRLSVVAKVFVLSTVAALRWAGMLINESRTVDAFLWLLVTYWNWFLTLMTRVFYPFVLLYRCKFIDPYKKFLLVERLACSLALPTHPAWTVTSVCAGAKRAIIPSAHTTDDGLEIIENVWLSTELEWVSVLNSFCAERLKLSPPSFSSFRFGQIL